MARDARRRRARAAAAGVQFSVRHRTAAWHRTRQTMPTTSLAYSAASASSPLSRATIQRRDVGPLDVEIEILFCGVCHSDLHTARGEWQGVEFPVVPGHEIVGRVTRIGRNVTRVAVGETAAVGCLVDSCGTCPACAARDENYCEGSSGMVMTYNSPDAHFPGRMTYGGYAKSIVVTERFVLRVPKGLDLAAAAPLLCAGITTYSPLKHWGAGPGTKIGIVGLGGLGHMGVKFAAAFGAHTVLFTTSPNKIADGKRLGADEVVISKDADAMAKHANSFDMILDTVSAPHDLDAYTNLLRRDGTLVLVGAPATPHPSPGVFPLIMKRRRIAGSLIGGIRETQEMLDFCGKRGITCDIELIPIAKIEDAYRRMLASDVKYRFVIDMSTLK
jgi:uncharacterized zinc-type alcohol dehydrogenase-like protein